MRLRDIVLALDAIAPLRYAESWDNVGLLVGDPEAEVKRALLTIDCTHAVLDEAEAAGASLVVAYHPPLFEAVKRIAATSLIHRAIRSGVALYSPHTALDVAPGGTNDLLADVLGARERAPLKLSPLDPTATGAAPGEPIGIGRFASLAEPTPRKTLIDRAKQGLGVSGLLVAGPVTGDATRIAVCAGAGRSLLGDALAKKAELFLTGELPHHDALRAASAGMTVVCALHSNSERATLPRLRDRLLRAAPGVTVTLSEADRDPFVLL